MQFVSVILLFINAFLVFVLYVNGFSISGLTKWQLVLIMAFVLVFVSALLNREQRRKAIESLEDWLPKRYKEEVIGDLLEMENYYSAVKQYSKLKVLVLLFWHISVVAYYFTIGRIDVLYKGEEKKEVDKN